MNDTQVVLGGGPKIQQISGSVSTTVDTTGLATSAKQDTLLTELQLKADLTETQPVSLASVPSHAVTNAGTFETQVTTVNGVAPAFGSGVRGATVQRVTIATDDSVPVTLASNQSVNVAQVNGVTPLMGNGATGTGSLRVTIANDNTAIPVATHAVTIASGGIASGGIASGAIASGAVASGAIASGVIAAGAIAAGATSIADNEDVARAAADRLVKVAQVRVDNPPSGANVSGTEDYTQFIADSYGKTWVAGSVTEDVAHAAGESIMGSGVRRIDTAASSAGSSGDWATMDASAEGAVWVTNTPTTTSGLSVANFTSGDTYTSLTNTAQVIKATAGNLYGYYIYNPNATATYVMVYNIAAASVTVGTSTALLVFCIPATAGANLMFPYPITFNNAGWSIAATTTGGGSTAPATALEAMIWYK